MVPMDDEDVRLVPLPGRGGDVRAYVIVDAADYKLAAGSRWYLSAAGYAHNPEHPVRLLHRAIMGCVVGDGREVDHVNGNRLDNRRSNLRFCTHAENMANRVRLCCPRCGGEIPERPAKPSDSRKATRERKRRQRARLKAEAAG